jgi:hypothetical protein
MLRRTQVHKAHTSTAEVNGGKPTIADQQQSPSLAAQRSLARLAEISQNQERVLAIAITARAYSEWLEAKGHETDCTQLHVLHAMIDMLGDARALHEIEEILKPIAAAEGE